MTKKSFITLLMGTGLTYLGARYFITVASPQPVGLGSREPGSGSGLTERNSISSQAPGTSNHIAPLTYDGPIEETCAKLLDVIASIQRGTVVTAHTDYIHVEFRSLMGGFIDDTEFFLGDGRVDLRSTARLSWLRQGPNRQRLETIKRRFDAL
ncbi:MAG: DUF1499 domain-containing protein [Anaerolineae bacterium]|nr:DUF1499 domain-containing protein [Anaerolineae bacterium]